MQEIYELLCDVVGKEKDYTKEGIETLLKDHDVIIIYENEIKTYSETLLIFKEKFPENYIKITKERLIK